MSQKVFCGLSGGVDSALACALLAEQGYDVTAVYMRNWSRDLPGFKCAWADDLADAERVAVAIDVPLEVWDCEAEYKATVVDYLVDAYARGLTPNPDVMCNQTVKFGTFAQRAFERGADFVATGHYARVEHGEKGVPTAGGSAASAPAPARLLRARDEHKDQTYFLWRVSGTVLDRALFPVGGYASKAEVRAACAQRGLGVEAKPDSDGICFVGEVGIRPFLLQTLERRPGDIVEWETGRVLGRHEGAFLFTVGQRKGLDLGGGPARYVVATDVDKNVVYVTADHQSPALFSPGLAAQDVRWISGEAPAAGTYLVRTRHTGELCPAQVEPLVDGRLRVDFGQPRRRVAPGQSVVVYDGEVCLGGGVVSPSIPK